MTTIQRRGRTAMRRLVFLAALTASAAQVRAQDIPARLSDTAFWKLVTDISEPNGYFRSDNFVSNENTFQSVVPELARTTKPGGVYLGVGPDQNFTYIVGLRPKIAFILDIRRGNLLEHLMYKAVIEESADRADFLSRLFSRPRPQGLDTASSAQALFQAFYVTPGDTGLYKRNLAAIKDRLTKRHGFKLDSTDLKGIEYVYQAFFLAGPELNYNFSSGGGYGRGRMPSFAELQMEDDGQGQNRAYLGREVNYRLLRDLETNNLIVPVVGDFAGPKALRAIGQYLKERNATVTAFYLSNVEQYLFQQNDDWRHFFQNVGAMPLDASSTFIRSVFSGMGFRFNTAAPGGPRSQTLLASMLDQVKAFNEGRILSYSDVIQTSR